MTIWTAALVLGVAVAAWLVLGLARWTRGLPKTSEGWQEGARRQDAAFRAAVPEVARAFGFEELAVRAEACLHG
jgi:hypothetical protein